MRGRRFVVLALAAALASTADASSSDCSFCRYAAWNCTSQSVEQTSQDASVQNTGKTSELRTENDDSIALQAVEVCNADGKIQVDDVFCDSNDCECADGRQCVSLVVGCEQLFQARNRKRCIGDSAIQQRFQQCAVKQKLTAQTQANLAADWVHFKDSKLCLSDDCLAVRRFYQCRAVRCGYMIVGWKENSTEYRFVIDGSRASDLAAGTFLFSMPIDSSSCSSITSSEMKDCYALQTRNQKNGTCSGVYLQLDTKLKATGYISDLSKLSNSLWRLVVGSVAAAAIAVISVLVIFVRYRRSQPNEELDDLLQQDQGDCKTPMQDSTPAVSEIRQRALSPKSQQH